VAVLLSSECHWKEIPTTTRLAALHLTNEPNVQQPPGPALEYGDHASIARLSSIGSLQWPILSHTPTA